MVSHRCVGLSLMLCMGLLSVVGLTAQDNPCAGGTGDNVFTGGDLGAGSANVWPDDPGIAPGYDYNPVPPPIDGQYCLANDTGPWGWFAGEFWVDTGDNSSDPNGYMMVVNAGYQPGIFYQQTVPVCGNTPYLFSADILNLFRPGYAWAIRPNVDFLADGQVIYSTGDMAEDMTWHTFEVVLTTPPGADEVTFAVRNNAPGGNGNDLALDNFSLRFCSPLLSLPPLTLVCNGTATLTPVYEGNPWPGIVYQWQMSTDNGLSWADLPGETGYELTLQNASPGVQYRLLAAGNAGQLTTEGCRLVSSATTIQPVVNEVFIDTLICEGDAVEIGGQWFTNSGCYNVLLSTSDGCDSLVVLQLSVLPRKEEHLSVSICESEIYMFENMELTQPGTYEALLTSSDGCDSLVVLQLSVLPRKEEHLSVSICESEIYMFENMELTQPGTYEVLLASSDGCDSLVVLDLTVQPVVVEEQHTYLCEGEAYGGIVYQQNTLLCDTLQNPLTGCDSVVWMNLHLLPRYELWQEVVLCYGEEFDGLPFYEDTHLVHEDLTTGGCDSITHFDIRVVGPVGVGVDGPEIICAGETATLTAGQHAGYLWSDGSAGPSITVSLPGTYTVTVTDLTGCTASAVHPLVVSAPEAVVEAVDPLCRGDRNGIIAVSDVGGGIAPYYFSLNGALFQQEGFFANLASGVYLLSILDAPGCETEQTVYLEEPPAFAVSAGDDLFLDLGDSVQLQLWSTLPLAGVEWSPGLYLSCDDCPAPVVFPFETTVYNILATSANGCQAHARLRVFTDKKRNLYAPTAFSPNGDGINDFFVLYPGPGVADIRRLEVFDRWGGEVYSMSRSGPLAAPGSPWRGWDGRHRGLPAAPGVYVWLAEVAFLDGAVEVLKGEVSLVR